MLFQSHTLQFSLMVQYLQNYGSHFGCGSTNGCLNISQKRFIIFAHRVRSSCLRAHSCVGCAIILCSVLTCFATMRSSSFQSHSTKYNLTHIYRCCKIESARTEHFHLFLAVYAILGQWNNNNNNIKAKHPKRYIYKNRLRESHKCDYVNERNIVRYVRYQFRFHRTKLSQALITDFGDLYSLVSRWRQFPRQLLVDDLSLALG